MKTVRPTFLDRAIGVVSPAAMVSRIKSRMQAEILTKRSYDAATPSRSNAGWRKGSTSADAEIAAAGPMLRDAMRDLVRNNPHAAKAVSALVAYIVGPGIIPRARTGDRDLDRRINDLWKRFSDRADADNQLDIYGLQTLAVREMIEGGEVLIRRRWRRASDGLPVPVQFQVLEGDLIDSAKEGPLPNGGFAIQGVEFSPIGQRRAYWLWSSHPGNSHLDPRWTLMSSAVPASEIAHLYEKQRTQIRGTPWGTPAISAIRDLGDYEAAEIMRKKIEACAVGVVTGEEEGAIGGISDTQPGVYDADMNLVERFEPGMFLYAKGGRQITFHQPTTSGGYEAFKRASLHTIAAGFRVPYSVISGDLSQNNYASQKAGMADFHRLVESTQWQVVIPMLCRPIWQWFCEAAFAAGLIPSADVPVEWNPPMIPSADPEKDAIATLLEIRSGTKTLGQAIAAKGYTLDDLIDEMKETNDKLDAAGIVLDSDPRATTKNGQLQIQIGAGGGQSGAPQQSP